MSIVVCEPQCRGFEHAMFNAALLRMIAFAYPEGPLDFLAEPDHLREVRKCLEAFGTGIAERIRWREMEIPPAERGVYWGRFMRATYRAARRWCEDFRRTHLGTPPRLLV